MKKFGFMIVLPMAAFLFACSDDHFSGSGVRLYTSEFSACLDPRVTNAYDGKVTDVDQHTTNYAFDSFGECESASGEYKVSNGEPSLTLQLMCGGSPSNCGIDPVFELDTSLFNLSKPLRLGRATLKKPRVFIKKTTHKLPKSVSNFENLVLNFDVIL